MKTITKTQNATLSIKNMKITYIPKTEEYFYNGKPCKQRPVNIMMPTRILIEKDYGVPPNRTTVKPDIIFIRDDGWSLGASREMEVEAYNLWLKNWTHFAQAPTFLKQPICEYLKN